jgi:formylglycine-generating enzyme required for sulfatase activity
MFCANCEAELPENAKFCSNCGAPVPSSASVRVRQDAGTVEGEVIGAVLGDGGTTSGLDVSTTQTVGTVEAGGSVVGTIMVGKITHIEKRALSRAEEARQRQAFAEESLLKAVAAYAAGLRERLEREAEEPYPGLYPYELTDRGCFFGRSRAVEELLALIRGVARRHRLIVLHGESGTGKTSMLRAGLAPQLLMAGHLPVRVEARAFSPDEALKRKLIPTLDRFAELRDMPLNAFLRLVQAALEPGETLFVFLDQFEDFFLSKELDDLKRQRFVGEMRACLDDEVLDVHFLIAIRDDQFAHLNDFKRQHRILWIENVYRLQPLSAAEAAEILSEPIRQQGFTYETGLVQEIVKDIGEQKILPAQLQLVCRALYRSLEPGQTTITRQHYQTQGRVEGILRNHLARVLSDIETRVPVATGLDRASVSVRDLANYILVSLVERVPISHRRPRTLANLLADTRVDEALLQSTLEELVRERLIHITGAEPGVQAAYELAHDSLIDQIAHDREIATLQNVMDLLKAEVDFWHRHGVPMSRDRLAIVETMANKLRLGVDALDLLFRSALAHGCSLDLWRAYAVRNRLTAALADRWAEALKDDATAGTAIRLLSSLSDAEAVSRLTDLIASSTQDNQEVSLNAPSPVQRKAFVALAQMDCVEAEAYLRGLTPDSFCFVPAGPFEMGSEERVDEQPKHSVWLPAFWMARSPVTVDDWRRFVEAGAYTKPRYWVQAEGAGVERRPVPAGWKIQQASENHPARNLTWHEAMAYAAWLGETSGLSVALPTEAEWEKAAGWDREAGQARRYPWGDASDVTRCNVEEAGLEDTTPVGHHSPTGDSPCGAQDMAGNVLEWTRTEYRGYRYHADDGREAVSGDRPRVLRGGAFNRNIEDARCARRHLLDPAIGLSSTGCRVCLRLVPLTAEKSGERPANVSAPG